MNFLYRTLTKREVGKFSLLFRQTCRLNTCMFKSFSWEKFGKIWNKLSRCAKILINQQNASIFWRCARLRKTDNKFYVTLWESFKSSPFMRIFWIFPFYENLLNLLFMIICENLSLLWESFLIFSFLSQSFFIITTFFNYHNLF